MFLILSQWLGSTEFEFTIPTRFREGIQITIVWADMITGWPFGKDFIWWGWLVTFQRFDCFHWGNRAYGLLGTSPPGYTECIFQCLTCNFLTCRFHDGISTHTSNIRWIILKLLSGWLGSVDSLLLYKGHLFEWFEVLFRFIGMTPISKFRLAWIWTSNWSRVICKLSTFIPCSHWSITIWTSLLVTDVEHRCLFK